MLGGSKVGSHAWGLAWVDTMMDLPTSEEEEYLKNSLLQRVQEADAEEAQATAVAVSVIQPVPSTPLA